jgi:tetratricopeptide (TPR) repeat protein
MRPAFALRLAGAIAVAAALAACAPMPPEAPKPVTPQVTVESLRARAKEQLASGIKLYETGDYDAAAKSLQASLDHGLLDKTDQSAGRKYLAFIHCLGGREAPCAAEFRRAFEIDTTFSLTPAEDGHPIWGPVYRSVRTQLIAEREAAQGRSTAPLGKAEQLLAEGIVKYDAGDFTEATRLLEAALKEGLKQKPDQVRAMKHVAFCLCLQGKYPACRAQFLKIFEVDPDFDLTPAEVGHPNWNKTFTSAKAQAKKPGAPAPKKNPT